MSVIDVPTDRVVSASTIRANYEADIKAEDDRILAVRFFFRPASFGLAAALARFGVQANSVTWASLVAGLLGSLCFLLPQPYWVAGCLGLILWALLDHVDGNLARYYESTSTYGDLLDTVVCYVILTVFPVCLAAAASRHLPPGMHPGWIAAAGGTSVAGALLPRLIYQKVQSIGRRMEVRAALLSEDTRRWTLVRVGMEVFNNIVNPSGFLFFLMLASVLLHLVPAYLIGYGVLQGAFAIVSVTLLLRRGRGV